MSTIENIDMKRGLIFTIIVGLALGVSFFLYTDFTPANHLNIWLNSVNQKKLSKLEENIVKDSAISDAEEIFRLYASESLPKIDSSKKIITNVPSAEESSLRGTIFFSGVRKQDSEKDIQIYSFEPDVFNFYPDKFLDNYTLSASPAFTSPGANVSNFFFRTIPEIPKDFYKDPLGISLYDKEQDTVISYKYADGLYQRHLAWSARAGLLAYSSFVGETADYLSLLNINNWEIVLFNPQEDRVLYRIPNSIQPRWSPDGTSLLYFKLDGLYIQNIDTHDERSLIALENQSSLTATSMFDLSNDGKYIIWTTAKKGTVTVYEIDLKDSFKVNYFSRITEEKEEFYWPTFSPYGLYYVVQAINSPEVSSSLRKNPRMEVRSVLTHKVVRSYPLDSFEFDQLFTDDWTE